MSDVLNKALSQVTPKRAREVEISLNLGPISAKLKQALEKGINVEVKSVNAAVSVLEYIAALSAGEQIIIVDEFDRMDPEQRSLFSDLVKQVSDQSIGVKFIFCGVASSLDEFVGFHGSVGRYVFAIYLDRIDMDSRKTIVSSAYDEMGVSIDESMLTRIAQISDGYPYFVHLIGEQIIFQLHRHSIEAKRKGLPMASPKVLPVHFEDGVQSSVAASEGFLKDQYEKAIMAGNNTDFELVLWATAEGPTLTRKVGDIYDDSYIYLCDQFGIEPVAIEKFRSRMTALRKNHGEVLRSSRAGWYEFSENMMRGYVRMRAIAAGASLSPDHHFGARRRQF